MRSAIGLLSRRPLVGVAMLTLVLAAAACGSGNEEVVPSATPSPTPAGYLGMVLDEPMPKPDFTLTDTDGNPYNFRQETEGYLTYLYFGYTYCPDICPSHMADIASVMKRQPEFKQKVKVVFVTIDPDRDTPDRLRAGWTSSTLASSASAATPPRSKTPRSRRSATSGSHRKSTPADGGEGYIMSHAAFVQLYTLDNVTHRSTRSAFRQTGTNTTLSSSSRKVGPNHETPQARPHPRHTRCAHPGRLRGHRLRRR
jgi:protein SCO1/2